MKSPDVLDPVRLRITDAEIRHGNYATEDEKLIITVEFEYTPWWSPLSDANILWEQANAFACVNEALKRGGVVREW